MVKLTQLQLIYNFYQQDLTMNNPTFHITTQFQAWDGPITGLATLDDGTLVYYSKNKENDIIRYPDHIKRFIDTNRPDPQDPERPELVYRDKLFSICNFDGDELTVLRNPTYSLYQIPKWIYDELKDPHVFYTKFPLVERESVEYWTAVVTYLKTLESYPCLYSEVEGPDRRRVPTEV